MVKAWKTKRTPFYVTEVECPRNSESANTFYDFVADAGIKNSSKVSYTPRQTILSHEKSNFFPKSVNEIKKLDELDNKFSSGLDNISNSLLKISSQVSVPYLIYLINLTFINGKFPKALAKAKVTPLHNVGDKTHQKTIISQYHCLLLE